MCEKLIVYNIIVQQQNTLWYIVKLLLKINFNEGVYKLN